MNVRRSIWLAALAALLAVGWLIPAGEPGAEGPPRRAGREGRGARERMSPEERAKRMEELRKRRQERLREELGASEEQWKKMEPLIQAVGEAQLNLRGGRGAAFAMARRPRQPGGQEGPPQPREEDLSEVGKKRLALRELLDKEDAKADEIKAALETFRAARKQAEAALAKARADLRAVVNPRQEALLVLRGTLD